jgi:exodeoxyribonuclease VII large subunit
MDLPQPKIYSVSELTEEIKNLLERKYPAVWVQGEVSNFRPAASGHFYFTLKDESAQIKAVMFKTQSRFLKFRPEDGLKVTAWGRVTVYSPRGEYQIVLDTMEPSGIGALMVAFEQLKARLLAEGIFDSSRKKALPRFPKTVGVVTSPRGSVVRDMIRTIGRRWPGTRILVSPTVVQGDRAPSSIVVALDRLCAVGDVEVIILGRGGGSMEDLWAFNDERVVRAVAACPTPVVSAVGHETDITLTDFAADLRASTPSAAAEMVVPDRRDLHALVLQLAARQRMATGNVLDASRSEVSRIVQRIRDPRKEIDIWRQYLDDMTGRLGKTMRLTISRLNSEAESTVGRLRPQHLTVRIAAERNLAWAVVDRLKRASSERLRAAGTVLENLTSRMDAMSPRGVLGRGYALVVRPTTGDVISDAMDVRPGEDVAVHLHRGELACRVTGRRAESEQE